MLQVRFSVVFCCANEILRGRLFGTPVQRGFVLWFYIFTFPTGLVLAGKHTEMCNVLGWEWVFVLTTRATQHHHSHLSHIVGSHSTFACSPTEPPWTQQFYRTNPEFPFLFVRSCCFITAVWLMSNLALAQKDLWLFSFCKIGSRSGMSEGGS